MFHYPHGCITALVTAIRTLGEFKKRAAPQSELREKGKWREGVGVEPTLDVNSSIPDLKPGELTGVLTLSRDDDIPYRHQS